ncbi:hypothetical protein M5C90_24240 [Pseudomonas chlororaphis subsp. piscium]|uniref:hypothetical protein n=1 Tax=Pseudomonas chlororaphis TaxID=587753 RepID=UPI000F57F79E|nr:hypothetical protein [Pseudomonas chlororaphis]AZD86822.1 hypothetical protein C4K14_4000 [Pseudomonas chlororaphis subsp. aureofaciens]UQS88696.1 hypothetical protein M5C90_24240 [Pseudomonas chlororaphis subsp. piscium]
MSQHLFKTVHKGFTVTVQLGWDRPMGYFFMVIHKPENLIDSAMMVDDDDYLYSNLHEIHPFGKDLDYYRQVLRHFDITVPESMFIETQRDCESNAGNRVATHQADGSFTEQNV